MHTYAPSTCEDAFYSVVILGCHLISAGKLLAALISSNFAKWHSFAKNLCVILKLGGQIYTFH